MPGDDLKFDDSGDFILTDAGEFETTPTAASAVRHQVMDRLGEWVGDISAGRVISGIAGRNDTQEQIDIEEDSVVKALQVLVVEGLIADVQSETDKSQLNRHAIRVTSRDTATGGTIIAPSDEFGS